MLLNKIVWSHAHWPLVLSNFTYMKNKDVSAYMHTNARMVTTAHVLTAVIT